MNARYAGAIYLNSRIASNVSPDSLPTDVWNPSADFVLCRDHDGNPTAIYGNDVWDFNPYRLSARRLRKINFAKVGVGASNRLRLVDEVKKILFLLIYTIESGRLGKLSASSLVGYFEELRAMADFCVRQGAKPLVGELTIKQLLTNEIYLSGLILERGESVRFRAKLSALLRYLANAGAERLGYKVLQRRIAGSRRDAYEQHLVIPTRLYLNVINSLGDRLDLLRGKAKNIEDFISCFTDAFFGRTNLKQKQMGVGGRRYHRPVFRVAVQMYELENVLIGDFLCSNRKNLPVAIASIQLVLKTIIHLYTGMRDQEVMRLTYDCLMEECTHAVFNSDGIEMEPERMVQIISTTTKYEGHRREESWLATKEVVDAVEIARAICSGLAKHFKIPPEGCPLFLNPAILTYANSEVGVRDYYHHVNAAWRDTLTISSADLSELSATDPLRNFKANPLFAVGNRWPLKSHQFRRSLAFYASNSGFVSLPTLRAQFKHLTIQMARYYANNFDKLKTIFGYYDDETGEFSIPSSHVSLEFQMGIPVSLSNQLIDDLFQGVGPIFGGTGSYIEKQKARVASGEIAIAELRSETVERMRRGELSYRSTLLGGCTKVGWCDLFMLGHFTACLSCEDSVINFDKLEDAIVMTNREVDKYEVGSGEFQVVSLELERLQKFKEKILKRDSSGG